MVLAVALQFRRQSRQGRNCTISAVTPGFTGNNVACRKSSAAGISEEFSGTAHKVINNTRKKQSFS